MRPYRTTLIKSIQHALHGLYQAVRLERNIKLILIIELSVLGIASMHHLSPMEWICMLLSMGFTLSTELLNTAIEIAVDLVTKKKKYRAMLVKDISAGSVLICAVVSMGIWALILVPKITCLKGVSTWISLP